jgi:hypothetical protein
VRELPSAVLRAAIARVHGELSGDGDESSAYAGFRSSLPTRPEEHPDFADDDDEGEADALG